MGIGMMTQNSSAWMCSIPSTPWRREGLPKEFAELLHGRARLADKRSKRALRKFSVIRNGQAAIRWAYVSEDNVTAGLMVELKTNLSACPAASAMSSLIGCVANFAQEVMKGELPLSMWGLSGEGVELFGRCEALVSSLHHQLLFLDHVHELNSHQRVLGCVERFEPQHGTGDALDRSMVLFHDIV